MSIPSDQLEIQMIDSDTNNQYYVWDAATRETKSVG